MATWGPEFVELTDVTVLREVPHALVCRIDSKQVWIPRGQIANGDVPPVGQCGSIVVPRWLYNGLIR